MQKYILLTLGFIGCSTLTAQTDTQKFLDKKFDKAIERIDVEKVKNLLLRAGELEPAYRKVLFDDARYRIRGAQEQVSLLKSRKDLLFLTGGIIGVGVCGLAAGFAALLANSKRRDVHHDIPTWMIKYASTAVPFLMSGVWFSGSYARQAYRCSYAQGRVETARKIAKLIGQTPVTA